MMDEMLKPLRENNEMLKNNKELRDKITNNFKELWQIY